MAEQNDRQRKPQDRGSRSPANEEAKEQGMSGNRGAEEGRVEGEQRQPPQGSDRAPAARHQQPAEERKGFSTGQAPSEQGEKAHPSAEVVKQNQQGATPRSGSHAGGDRSEEEAQRGSPSGDHTRHGREGLPGHRPGHRS